MHSYWENKQWFSNIDHIIIGSGIVGLTCAIELKTRFPSSKTVIVEKGYLPSGASSKNAGFACFGSASELISDLTNNFEEDVFELVKSRVKGLNLLQKRCGIKAIDFQNNGGYELFSAEQNTLFQKCKIELSSLNKFLFPIFKANVFEIKNKSIQSFGFKGIENIIYNQFEGQIDTGKMITKLLQIAKKLGIQIWNGMHVLQVEQLNNKATIQIENGITINCKNLFVATNGFGKKLFPEMDIEPARAQVLITKEISNLKIKGTFHIEEGFYYFRNIDNRILIGGGRNLDFKTENTYKLETTQIIQNKLKQLLKNNVLPNTPFEIDYSWSGIMGVGNRSKTPIIKHVTNNIHCGIRLGGMGVALGSTIGENLAKLLDK